LSHLIERESIGRPIEHTAWVPEVTLGLASAPALILNGPGM
jgi:hypothetical protein